jgi:hypothetical protein
MHDKACFRPRRLRTIAVQNSTQEIPMTSRIRFALALVAAATLFSAGYLAGQNKFGQPKTIIHVSLIKWKADAPEAEQQKALNGVLEMARRIPGIKNVWVQLKPRRMQPRDYHSAFVIEFENEEAAIRYAEDPFHAEWAKHFLSIRETSISPQVTN